MQLFTDAQFLSPYAMSVYVGLQVKAVPFALKTVDLSAGAQRQSAYAAASLTQRVPLLEDGDFQLSESSAITEYLDERLEGPALYPSALQDKARARQVQAWLRSDLLPLRAERPTTAVFLGQKFPALTPAGQQAADKLIAAASALLPKEAPSLFGAWCIADVDLAMMLQRLVQHGDPVPAPLERYARAQWEHFAVKRWLQLPR